MSLQITPNSTPTRMVRESSEPQSTQGGREVHHVWPKTDPAIRSGWIFDIPVSQYPAEEALLKVVMTFGGRIVRMEAVDIGVSVEGRTAPKAYGRLIDEVRDYLNATGDEQAELLRYTPDTWFKFVPPDQARYQRTVPKFWPEGESVEDFIAAATEGRYEEDEDEPDS